MTSLSLISSQTAVATLRGVNEQIADTQARVASGKKIASASDNPGLWRAAQTAQTQMSVFTALGESLTSAKATVSVAKVAAEQIVSTLGEIKTKISSASDAGANTAAIQSEIDALRAQIDTAISGASLGGANLLQNRLSGDNKDFTVLAGLTASGAATNITIDAQDLQTTAAVFGSGGISAITDYVSAPNLTVTASGQQDFDIAAGTVAYGASYRLTLGGAGGHALNGVSVPAIEYVARKGDTNFDVAKALGDQIQDVIDANNLGASMAVTVNAADGRISLRNLDADPGDEITLNAAVRTGGAAGGGLAALNGIDVTTADGRSRALATIDTLIADATSAAAQLGSGEKRIDIQNTFVTSMSTTLQDAISSMVDADVEAEAAKLTALEVQQELAVESLSIANQARKNLIELFR